MESDKDALDAMNLLDACKDIVFRLEATEHTSRDEKLTIFTAVVICSSEMAPAWKCDIFNYSVVKAGKPVTGPGCRSNSF
jgi:hypothetical protein